MNIHYIKKQLFLSSLIFNLIAGTDYAYMRQIIIFNRFFIKKNILYKKKRRDIKLFLQSLFKYYISHRLFLNSNRS